MTPCTKRVVDKKYFLAGRNIGQEFSRHPVNVELLRLRLFIREEANKYLQVRVDIRIFHLALAHGSTRVT